MIVVDASALIDVLLHGPRGMKLVRRIERDRLSLHAPDLIMLEVAQVLRKACARRRLSEARAQAAFEALTSLRMQRYEHADLLERIWSLRRNLTAYDAAYVALAESLDAPLLTLDAKLAKASGHAARVEVLS